VKLFYKFESDHPERERKMRVF